MQLFSNITLGNETLDCILSGLLILTVIFTVYKVKLVLNYLFSLILTVKSKSVKLY